MKVVNVKMDDELHKAFKIKVATDDSNMQDKIIQLIKEYLDNYEVKNNV